MSELHTLLREAVADVAPPELAGTAWQRARGRRRRRLAVAASAVVAVVVAGSVAALAGGQRDALPAPQPTTTTTAPVELPPEYHGFDVFLAPEKADEARLPQQASALPTRIALGEAAPDQRDAPLDRALMAVLVADQPGAAQADHVLLVGEGGQLRRVTTLDLQTFRVGAEPFFPFTTGSLSPAGTRLALAYPGKVTVHTLATGAETTYAAGGHPTEGLSWAGEGGVVLGDGHILHLGTRRVGPPDTVGINEGPLAGFSPWGLMQRDHGQRAQSFFADHLDVVDAGVTNPQVVVTDGVQRSILALPFGTDQAGRIKGCCAVAGWLDDNTVAFESFGTTDRLLAWNDVTGSVSRLTELVQAAGGYRLATAYADLSPATPH